MSEPVSRRGVVLGVGGAAVAAASLKAGALAAAAPSRPNILFILADDLGYADLSCYGRREYRTRHLDRLAAEGLMMTDGYSNSPVCSPTRIALITGRYQYRLRAGLEEPIVRQDSEVGLPPGHPTLPSLLRRQGYRTSLVGKWHMGWPSRFGPLKSGYDSFFGLHPGATDYFTHGGDGAAVPKDTTLYEGDAPVERPGYLTDLLADRAVAEIRTAAAMRRPFFISLHFTAPHWPWQGRGDASSGGNWVDLFHRDGGSLEKYGEMVIAMDEAVGRVLAEVEKVGAARDTIVVFTSDNGGERFSDTWPFRGEKTDLLEGGIRVPQIVRWRGRIAAGRKSAQVMSSMDWFPTLLAAAGASPDPAVPPDGQNLLPVLTGRRTEQERTIFWRYKHRDQAAVRSGRWKYLRIAGAESLFDVAADPRERANLKDRQPDLVKALRGQFDAWNRTMLPYPEGSVSAGHE